MLQSFYFLRKFNQTLKDVSVLLKMDFGRLAKLGDKFFYLA